MPKVTVLMAVYNREYFVQDAISSILSQTFQDFEFLIINDGSTDRTREIISSFKDSRIALINNDNNLGIPRSLNRALGLAKGEFIARLDSDDISEPERIDKQVDFLEAHPDIALVGSWYREIDEQGSFLGEYTLPSDCTELRWGLLFYTPFLNSSVTFRKKEILQEVGLYNEEYVYAQDHELWVRIAKKFPIFNLDKYLVEYRIHPSSITLFHETHQYQLLFQSCISYMSSLPGCSELTTAIDKERFRRMQSFLNFSEYQQWDNLEFIKLQYDIKLILKLSQAFCDYYNLTPSEQCKHQSVLISCISRKLTHLALSCSHKRPSTALRFLMEAFYLKAKNMIKAATIICFMNKFVRSDKLKFNLFAKDN